MLNILREMMWLDRRHLTLAQQAKIRDDLTVTYGEEGKEEKFECFTFSPEWVQVPRVYGIRFLPADAPPKDCRRKNHTQWPLLQFPDGGSFRDGQLEAIEALCNAMIADTGTRLSAPCGSGKTLVALSCAAFLKEKTLFVVHKEDLAVQARDAATKFFPGVKLGHIQAGEFSHYGCHLTTALAQTLFTREHLAEELRMDFGMVVFDEGHRYPARVFQKVLGMFNCQYRLGISATWERKDGLEKLCDWHIGPISHEMKTVRLTGEYIQVDKQLPGLNFKTFQRGPTYFNLGGFLTALANNNSYTTWLAEQAVKAAKTGRKMLIVSDRTEQLENVRAKILTMGSGLSVGMYVGSDKTAKSREKLAVARMCTVILSTYGMMAEGTDVPELDTLVMATPRSSVEQVVGRIQRHSEGKRNLLIVDPVFQYGMFFGMAKKREKTYASLGFKPVITRRLT